MVEEGITVSSVDKSSFMNLLKSGASSFGFGPVIDHPNGITDQIINLKCILMPTCQRLFSMYTATTNLKIQTTNFIPISEYNLTLGLKITFASQIKQHIKDREPLLKLKENEKPKLVQANHVLYLISITD